MGFFSWHRQQVTIWQKPIALRQLSAALDSFFQGIDSGRIDHRVVALTR